MCFATVRLSRLTALLLLLAGVLALAQQSAKQTALDDAAVAFEQGKAAEAERKLESILKSHPNELRALILAGAVLDSQQRYSEAESYYQRALKVAPGSAQVLNNAGQSLSGQRKSEQGARILPEGREHRSSPLERQLATGANERGRQARRAGAGLPEPAGRCRGEWRSRRASAARTSVGAERTVPRRRPTAHQARRPG